MTFEQLSKETGKAGSLLHRYSKRGMPTSSAAEALAWISANVRQKASSKPAAAKSKRAGKGSSPKPRTSRAPASSYQEARTRSAIAEAQDRELGVLERRGVLVRRETIKAELGRRLAGLRDALLQIPARLAPVLAAETEDSKVHDILQDELYAVLAQVSEVAT